MAAGPVCSEDARNDDPDGFALVAWSITATSFAYSVERRSEPVLRFIANFPDTNDNRAGS
jgi:hypothetical protein